MQDIACNYKDLRAAGDGEEWNTARIGAVLSSGKGWVGWGTSKAIDFQEKISYYQNLNSGVAQSAERVAVNH